MKKNVTLLLLFLTTILFSQEKVQVDTISCTSVKEIDLKTYMDTYVDYEYSSLDRDMTKEFEPTFFGDKSKRYKKNLLSIFSSTRGELMMNGNKNYIPKENEIHFLFEIENNGTDSSTQKIFFKIGEKIKKSITDNNFKFDTLLAFLKCTIFRNDYFPENLVTKAFNLEIKN